MKTNSAKAKVSNYLKSCHDKVEFTVVGLASKLEVNDKAVSNGMRGMVAFGALTSVKQTGQKRLEYTVVKNTMAAFFLKGEPQPNTHVERAKLNGKGRGFEMVKKTKRRSPAIIDIDNRIDVLQSKIDLLKQARKILK